MQTDVYFNLHRKPWSLRDRRAGRVVGHPRAVIFPHGASFVVQAAGRATVRQTGHKVVHAFVRGDSPETFDHVEDWHAFGLSLPNATRVTYNPHRDSSFVVADTLEPIAHASCVVMVARQGKKPDVWAVPK